MSRGRRRIGDAFAPYDHDATRTDGDEDAHDFKSTPTTPVTWPPPYRAALTGPDGHGAARVKDEEADPGNVPSGHNRDCFIPL